jgi:hypothetical protein
MLRERFDWVASVIESARIAIDQGNRRCVSDYTFEAFVYF